MLRGWQELNSCRRVQIGPETAFAFSQSCYEGGRGGYIQRFARFCWSYPGVAPVFHLLGTDTGLNIFYCALASTLETYDDPANGTYSRYSKSKLFWLNHFCDFFTQNKLSVISLVFSSCMDGFVWLGSPRVFKFNGCVRARLQGASSVCSSARKYPEKASTCSRGWYWDYYVSTA